MKTPSSKLYLIYATIVRFQILDCFAFLLCYMDSLLREGRRHWFGNLSVIHFYLKIAVTVRPKPLEVSSAYNELVFSSVKRGDLLFFGQCNCISKSNSISNQFSFHMNPVQNVSGHKRGVY